MRNQSEKRVFKQCLFYRVSLLNFTVHFEKVAPAYAAKQFAYIHWRKEKHMYTLQEKKTCACIRGRKKLRYRKNIWRNCFLQCIHAHIFLQRTQTQRFLHQIYKHKYVAADKNTLFISRRFVWDFPQKEKTKNNRTLSARKKSHIISVWKKYLNVSAWKYL